ncbi:hypothetical protein V8G56_09965 [Gaetbulibacter aquiaggeris]|uniref:Cardiolipin synthetase n=1 Tax=Gaetbulibacter aquiaggeris TaxID=1735373 RepID=A0ABW7MQF1_9FLAO
MKILWYLLTMVLLLNCSSTKLVDSWVDQESVNFTPKKVLVLGITDNLTARKIFEGELTKELQIRNINAVESFNVFTTSFISTKQTEDNIEKEVERLSENGFDAILISTVKGVNQKTVYSVDMYRTDYYWRRFGRYYYFYQDVYFDPGYYENYNIYNVEASLFDLKNHEDKSLVWVASYNIIDPKSINTTVKEYVKAIIETLEKEAIIPSLIK